MFTNNITLAIKQFRENFKTGYNLTPKEMFTTGYCHLFAYVMKQLLHNSKIIEKDRSKENHYFIEFENNFYDINGVYQLNDECDYEYGVKVDKYKGSLSRKEIDELIDKMKICLTKFLKLI